MKQNRVLISHNKNWGFDEDRIVDLALAALKEKGLRGVELSVVFLGRVAAKKLNIKYRHKDYIPQVLGFPMSRERDEDGYVRLGDVVICGQKLKYEAKFLGKRVDEVSLEWLRHGVENLLKG